MTFNLNGRKRICTSGLDYCLVASFSSIHCNGIERRNGLFPLKCPRDIPTLLSGHVKVINVLGMSAGINKIHNMLFPGPYSGVASVRLLLFISSKLLLRIILISKSII